MRLPKFVQRRRRADGSFAFRAWCVVEGRRVYSPPFSTAAEAHAEAMRMREDGGQAIEFGLTVEQAFEAVKADARTKRSSGTASWYADRFAALLEAFDGSKPLHSVTAAAIERYVEARVRSVSATTVNHELNALRRAFNLAKRRGQAIDNPVERVDRPRMQEQRRHFFTPEELPGILRRIAEHDASAADFFAVLAGTGLRRSEVLRLRADHVDLEDGLIWVLGKSRNETVPVAPAAMEPLRRLLPSLPLSDAAVRRLVKAGKAALGGDERLHMHALRHTYITALARAGTPIHVLQRLARLKSLRLLETYYHHGDEVRRALDGLKLG